MAEFEFTPAQKKAIQCIDRNVSVSAGAGSGKTRVLVNRFLYILSLGLWQPEKRILPREVLAVTFTRKAAAEMRERIRNEMDKKINSGTDKAYWQDQRKGLAGSQIGTIHSFCSSLLRSHPVECGLDPEFSVMEESDYKEFLQEETRDLLRSLLHKGESSAVALCTEYGSRSLLTQTIFLLQKGVLFQKGIFSRNYQEWKESLRQEAVLLGEEFSPELVASSAPVNRAVLEKNLDKIHEALAEPELPGHIAFLEDVCRQLKKQGKNKEVIGALRDRLQSVLAYPLVARSLTLLPLWEEYLLTVQAYLDKKKRKLGRLGFDDLETMALDLLNNHPEVLAGCRSRFKFIMVDEFQDTNERQRQLIYLLCGGDADVLKDKRLFVVGDPKQSIYRFRGADVSVFARVRNEIQKTGGEDILLDDNFRTVAPVLDFCNDIFPGMMGTERSCDVYYEALQSHRKSDKKPELQVYHYNSDFSSDIVREIEAKWLAKRLKSFHQEGIAFKDMAVLMQKMTYISVLTSAFREQQVPCTVVDGRGFYDRIEIQDMMNLFSFILNPHDNLNLAGVLRSVYFGLDDEILTRLLLDLAKHNKETGKNHSLWDYLLEQPVKKEERTPLVSRSIAVLKQILTAGTVLNLPDFCRELQAYLHPETVAAMQYNGEEQLANIRKFFRMADEFAADQQGTVQDFILHLLRMQEEGVREAAADVAAEDAVQLMTVHKSKGLEFQVVSVPFMDAAGKRDTEQVGYSRELGLGISVRDSGGQLVSSPVLREIKQSDGEKEQEEKVRLLYVAMTRARDRLVLSGGFKETKADSKTVDWMKVLLQNLQEDSERIVRTDIDVSEKAEEEKATDISVQNREITSDAFSHAVRNSEPLKYFGESAMTRFSASSLQEYAWCPRSYYYRFIEQIPVADEEETHGSTLPAAVLGTLVHEVLEKYGKWRMANRFAEDDAVWRGFYLESMEKLAEGRINLAVGAEEMLRNYLQSSLYKDYSSRQKFAEYSFQLPLLKDEKHTYIITGFIDGIAEAPDGSLQIVDYKSGQVPGEKHVADGYAWQLTLYKLAVESLLGKNVGKASLHFIRNCSEWILPDRDYKTEIMQICGEIAGKKTEEDFGPNMSHCTDCPFSYMCRR